jgi:hypothetical protein
LALGDGGEEVIVLHELEGSFDHCVLKVAGRIVGRNLAGEVLTDTKVFGPPPNELSRPDEARCDSIYGSLTRPLGPEQVHLDAAGKVKASLNGRGDLHALLNGNHLFGVLSKQRLPNA